MSNKIESVVLVRLQIAIFLVMVYLLFFRYMAWQGGQSQDLPAANQSETSQIIPYYRGK
jgi:hypothetical protein